MNEAKKLIAATLSVFALGGTCLAQPAEQSEDPLPVPSALQLTVGAGYEETFRSDIDSGGDFSITSANFDISLSTILFDDMKFTLTYQYIMDEYDFGGTTGLGGLNPWDDVESHYVSLIASKQLANDWTVFGGPIAQFARDRDARLGDSDTYGGMVGLSINHSETLTYGGGLGVITSLEESERLFPIIILNWQIKPDLRLATDTDAGRSGAELIYSVNEGFDIALGLAYEFKRFRLDDASFAPAGVAENTSLPAWVRMTFQLDNNLTVNLRAGMRFGGRLKIDNSIGNQLRDEDYDPVLFVGATLSLHF